MKKNSSVFGMIIAMSLMLSIAACSASQEDQAVQSANLPEGYALDDSQGAPVVKDDSAQRIREQQQAPVEPQYVTPKQPEGKDIYFNTSDGVRIAATIYKSDADSGVILVHMMGKDRKSWAPIITNLATRRAVIAIDLRGHGRSGGVLRKFTDDDYRAMVNDVAAARKELGKSEVAIIGASIGANAAIKYAASDPSVKTVIALSPGFDYHGLRIDDVAPYLGRRILVVASSGDQYSYNTMRKLSEMNKDIETDTITGDKHGTDMFGTGKGVESEIFRWTDALLS